MEELSELFHSPGRGPAQTWEVASEYADKDFESQRITNVEIAQSMAYARAGSDVPSSLHGIFWLDQYHQSSIAQTDAYRENKPFKHPPSAETLASFGEAPTRWDASSQCLGPTGNYGGAHGHWSYLDTMSGRAQLEGAIAARMTANLCFSDASMEKLEVNAGIRVPVIGKWLFVPSWMFIMRMERRPWGWNRVTTVGPNISSYLAKHKTTLEQVLPWEWMSILNMGDSGAFQYPAIQIIDGHGQRTRYFDEYLRYVSGEENNFKHTQLVGVEQHTFRARYEQECYAYTGESCTERPCSIASQAVCQAGRCVCKEGCVSTQGDCYNAMNNRLVAKAVTLRNAKWPSNSLYMQMASVYDQLALTNAPALHPGQDKFNIRGFPGSKAREFLLASDRWDEQIAIMQPVRVPDLGGASWALYAVDIRNEDAPWKPEDIALTICRVRSKGSIRIGTRRGVWAYARWDSYYVFGHEGNASDTGDAGEWIPDPALRDHEMMPYC